MPPRYRRRYAPRKRRGRNPSANLIKRYIGKRRNFKYGNLYRDVMMLKGLINTEIKYLDQSRNGGTDGYWDIRASPTIGIPNTSAGPPTPGYVSFMVDYPALGNEFNQRNGRSIKLKSLQVKGTIRRGDQTSDFGQCRVMIIVDHQAQTGEDTDPVPILFLPDNNGDYSMSSRVNRQLNKRYSVLDVKKVNISNNRYSYSLNMYKRLNDKIKFNGPNVQDFVDKTFHVVVLMDSEFPQTGTAPINPQFYAQFETRLTYVDN